MSRFKLLYFVIFIINLCRLKAQISDKRLCVDSECKVPISLAKTLLRYSSPDSRILSFAPNEDITIYSKSAGSRTDLWGGEINSKRGYFPKHMVRETKILNKPTLLVDTELGNDTDTKQVPSQVEPDKVQQPYEVVDGTTIYANPQDEIEPTSTESQIQSTALPADATKIDQVATSEQPPLKDPENVDRKAETSPQAEEIPHQEVVTNRASTEKDEPSAEKAATEGKTTAEKDENDLEIEEDDDDDEDDIDDEEDDDDDDLDEWEQVTSDSVVSPEKKPDATSSEQKTAETSPPKAADTSSEQKSEVAPQVGEQVDNASLTSPEKKLEASSEQKAEATVEAEQVNNASLVSPEKKADESVETSPPQAGEQVENASLTSPENKLEASSEQEAEQVENASLVSPKEADAASKQKVEAIVEMSALQGGQNIETKPEEIKSEVNDAIKEAIVADSPEDPVIKETLQGEVTTVHDEEMVKVSDSADVNPEIAAVEESEEKEEKSEVTTFSPEMEAPRPFDEGLAEVTPDPMEAVPEEAKVVENIMPTLPPLGLFNLNLNGASSEEVVTEVVDGGTTEPTVEDFSNVEALNDSSVQDDGIEVVEKNASEELTDRGNEAENVENEAEEKEDSGFLSGFMSMFGTKAEGGAIEEILTSDQVAINGEENRQKSTESEEFIFEDNTEGFCDAESCQKPRRTMDSDPMDLLFNFNSDVLLYLVTTAVSVIIFLFGYIAFDKSKREGPLVAKINNLEKELLIVIKENQILQDKICGDSGYETNDRIASEVVENLKQDLDELTNIKNALEEQVQSLEKELEVSTEVGMELNRMLTKMLSSESGSDVLKANVEHLQRQLVEQQATINSISETLAIANTENHELRLELELSNKKVVDLQAELDKLLLNILKIEEDKEAQQTILENEIATYKQKFEETHSKLRTKEEEYSVEVKQVKNRLIQTERNLELKMRELEVLTDTVKQLKTNDGPTLKGLLDANSIRAELQLLRAENQKFSQKLQQEEEAKLGYQKTAQTAMEEAQRLKEKYDQADRLKVETETKLEVLSNYFKDREAQLQKEIAKHESLWMEKQGEATSTTERIKFMQEQLQNYKAQTESLKQEIVSQEVELKSQISVLEKKAHENWVSARQAERKLEEAKQEAAQLRHRLTLRERAIHEDKNPHRYQSPIEQNGDMPVSPLESPASPPLLYGTRDHITKSPPIPGLPPFLPPPPGVPFMPPPLHGVPPFIPPPPTMFPGDHRPPPLGRMSSPPLNSRYSPSSRGYSPYDSSPSDSEYGTSPPQRRGYSPFNSRGDDRREYKRPPPGRTNGRNVMKDGGSSGSGHSNESLDKINRQHSKV